MSGWREREVVIKAARERLTAAERRREDRKESQRQADKAERKRQQNYDDLKALRRLDDRRDRKGRRS